MLQLLLAASLTTPIGAQVGDSPVVIQVDRVLTDSESVVEGGYLILRHGKVVAVGASEAPQGVAVFRFPGATACAGFIDPVTGLGAVADLSEPARAVTPEARAAEVLRADHSQFKEAARGGISVVGLSPTSSNVIGGRLAVVQTSGADSSAHLLGDGPLRLALASQAFERDRHPTSRMGAAQLLRELIAAGLPGEGPLVIEASTPDNVRLSLDLLEPTGRDVVLLRPQNGHKILDLLEDSGATVILGPMGITSHPRTLRVPGQFEKHRVSVAFTGNGDPEALRLTAALAVRAGMSPEWALAALTSVPASVLGLKNAGSLAPGKRADVIVTHGHPLDLGARIEAVFVGGAAVDLND